MMFDFDTLMVVLAFVTALMAVLAFCSWMVRRQDALLLPLTCAFLLGAAGILLSGLRSTIPVAIAIGAGNALILLAYGFLWKAVRGFERRRLPPTGIVAASALWLVACLYPPFYASQVSRVVLAAALSSAYAFLTVLELWWGREERLRSRWMALVVGLLHAIFMLLRVVLIHQLPFPLGAAAGVASGAVSWAAALPFEGIAYTVLTMCSLLLMDRERGELQQRRAANLDPLTGIANRRAFIDAAENIWCDKFLEKGICAAILIFDLDQFKQINDTFGHQRGDDVLILFTRAASNVLGPKAVFARLGGEEFAAVLECTGPEQACKVAEQVRSAFAQAALHVEGLTLESTVSIGLSVMDRRAPLSATLASADRALYRAKQRGRNRVEYQPVYPFDPKSAAELSSSMAQTHLTRS